VGKIYAGTSGWAYSTWKQEFYPPDVGSAKFLSHYATRLNSVEVNYTFRSFLTKKLLKDWIEATPPGFKFAVKAHQSITHIKRLRNAARLTSKFLSSLQPLRVARKLGPVLFQLPPFLKCDLELLKEFMKELPRQARCAIEFRHVSWFNDTVFTALQDANVALCLAESDALKTPIIRTADFSYLRLRREKYPPKSRRAVAKHANGFAKRGDVFVYFKHQEKPVGPLYAEELLAAVKHR
jgi:uncharacterized protein YecE (DUF72 family)